MVMQELERCLVLGKTWFLKQCYSFVKFYILRTHCYSTRNGENRFIKRASSTFSQNNLFHDGFIKYNGLLNYIKSCSSFNKFRSLCYLHVKEKVSVWILFYN